MTTLNGEFQLASWDEDTYMELGGGRRLSRAYVSQTFTGDLAGTGTVEWLMSYADDDTARFVGLQVIDGTVDDRAGTIVLETSGDFDGMKAVGRWTAIPGSGTGEFKGLEGEGQFEAPPGSKATYVLETST